MGAKLLEKGEEDTEPPSPLRDQNATSDSQINRDEAQQLSGFNAYKRIFQYATPVDLLMMGAASVAALASGTVMGLVNLIMGNFLSIIGDFNSGESSNSEFLRGVRTYSVLSTFAAYRVTRSIRCAYMKAALSQEIAFFDRGTSGAIAMQATVNGALIQGGISDKLGLVLQAIGTFVSAFVVAFVAQWKLTLITACIAPTLVLVIGTTAAIDSKIEMESLEIYGQAGSFAESILGSARTVHAFDLQAKLAVLYEKYLVRARKIGNKRNPLYGVFLSADYFVIYSGTGLAFWRGINMFASGEIGSIGTVFTVLMSVVVAASSFSMVAPYSVSFSRAASAAAQLFVLIDRKSEINPFEESGDKPASINGTIDIENVDFSYPTRPGSKVLSDFSLHVPAGKVTALVGASGSGKSTIVGLIERWYSPNAGVIKLDGKPIQDINLHWLRTNVRLVQQEPVLFNGTVFDNIANGLVGTEMEDASEHEQMKFVESAAKLAFAHDFISRLPEGYHTRIGERGGLLSGGQKQRVAIARSIISEPKILLLDEATSALDPHAEGIVQQALDNASRDRTTIVIAHKLATIRNADNIVVLSKGTIVEQGTHESLLARGEAYSRLVKAQNLSTSDHNDTDSDDESQAKDHKAEMEEDLTLAVTKASATEISALEARTDRDNYDNHSQFGVISAFLKTAKATPELNTTFFILAVTSALGAILFPAQALLFGKTVEVFSLTGSELRSQGNFFSLMFFVVAIGVGIVYFILGWFSNIVCQTLNQKFRRDLFSGMLRQDLQFFDRPENTVGALASRLDSYPQAVLELMGFNIMIVIVSVFSVLACSILGIVVSWKLGLVGVFAGLPPMIAAGYTRTRLDAKMDRDTSKRFANSASVASEAITAIRTASSLAIEKRVLQRYAAELDHAIHLCIRPLLHNMVWFSFTQTIDYFILALGFWWGSVLSSRGELSFYQFMVSFMGVFFSGQSIGQMFSFSSSITKGCNAINFYFWLQALEPVIYETPQNHDKGPKSGGQHIEFDNVRFSYPLRSETPVLRGVNLEVRPGQFVALVGASGCGKSTMIAMLERFYDPTSGVIRIDSEPLPQLNPRLYRKQLALVQQEPALYPGSIRENVSFGLGEEGDATDNRIEAALRAANAWDFVSSLPDGVRTLCGTSGGQLSGGQRQRVAIARALIREPRVILLDEATSALDTESERVVQAALMKAAAQGDRITIAVAHRLSTIKNADRICVFYGGKIVEAGTHDDLIELGGMYSQMCEAQSLEKAV